MGTYMLRSTITVTLASLALASWPAAGAAHVAPLSDGRVMQQLFLRVTALEVRDPSGMTVQVPLAGTPTPPFVDFDLLTLDNTATLLALGPVPNGTYREVIFTIDPANAFFLDLVTGVRQPVDAPHPTFEVEFAPPLVIDASRQSLILLDIRPDRIVEVVTPDTEYRLRNEVKAHVVGPLGSGPRQRAIHVTELEGVVTAVSCPAFTLSVAIVVDTSHATIIDETGVALTCDAIGVGDEVEVEGTLTFTGSSVILRATRVEVEGTRAH